MTLQLLPDLPQDVILLSQKIQATKLLGHGSKSWVFAFDNNEDLVLRVYKAIYKDLNTNLDRPDSSALNKVTYLTYLKKLYQKLKSFNLPITTPLIHKISYFEGRIYTTENRIKGMPLTKSFEINMKNRLSMYIQLQNLFKTIKALHLAQGHINKFNDSKYGFLIKSELQTTQLTSQRSWSDFIFNAISSSIEKNSKILNTGGVCLPADYKHMIVSQLSKANLNQPSKQIIHGNLELKNCMVEPNTGEVTGILNFSNSSLIGDPMLDMAGIIVFAEADAESTTNPLAYGRTYCNMLRELVEDEYGNSSYLTINLYRLYYAARLLNEDKYKTWALQSFKDFALTLEAEYMWPKIQVINMMSLTNRNTPPQSLFFSKKIKPNYELEDYQEEKDSKESKEPDQILKMRA